VHGGWQRVADLLRDASEGAQVGPEVAAVAAELLGVDDVSLTLVVAGQPQVTFATSDAAASLCGRQFALGEGPTVAALRSGVPTLLEDLALDRCAEQAPVFAMEALAARVTAVFAFPLRVGGALLGTMTAFRRRPGPLSAEEYADALILSTLVTVAMLQLQADEAERATSDTDGVAALRAVVQVAAGMVSEQLDVSVVDALVRLRAHAFVSGVSNEEVARRVVARELRLERGPATGPMEDDR
jgi:GAF domain-containing protein